MKQNYKYEYRDGNKIIGVVKTLKPRANGNGKRYERVQV